MKSNLFTRFTYIIAIAALALITAACDVIPNLKVIEVKTGPTQSMDIKIPAPAASSTGVALNLDFLAGTLKLSPGATGALVSGTATFNAVDFEPKVETSGTTNTVRQGSQEFTGIPKFSDNLVNEWDLKLASTPMSLNIEAIAYTGILELGGLSLEKLTFNEGGSNFKGAFSTPNRVKMSSLDFITGGSTLEFKGLANANFEQMSVNCGAGDYTLSFDGALQRDGNVLIDAGVGTVNLVVPAGVNAVVTYEGGLSGVKMNGAWKKVGDTYSLSGSGPTLTIKVKMGLGTLILMNE